MRDRDGKVVRWFGMMTDTSEQRKTEDALRQAHTAAPVAMVISRDPECCYILGNRRAYDLLHVPPGSNLSKSPPGAKLYSDEQIMDPAGSSVPGPGICSEGR
jgi:hypothetical protein